MRRLAAALLPGFLLLSISASAGDVLSSMRRSLPFKGGEKLVYAIHYKWGLVNADVCNATVKTDSTVLEGSSVYHFSVFGQTQKIYAKFFTVKESLDTWFGCRDLRAVRFTRDAIEGKYKCHNLYRFYWTPGDEHIDASLYNSNRGDYAATLPLNSSTFDVAQLICMIRNMDTSLLKAGESYPMSFAVDEAVAHLSFKYLGREDRKVPGLGVVKALKFSFQVVSGEVFSGGSDLYAWFSDDGNMIPVYFIAPLKIGRVEGRLTSWSGLKNDFSALSE